MPFEPIENYGVIGNMQSIALVGMNGSIDFLCYPNFDSPTIFAALLDDQNGGRFEVRPQLTNARVRQMYLPETNILITLKTRDATGNLIEHARSQPSACPRARIETDNCKSSGEPDISLIHALARAHLWLKALSDGTYQSIEELADVAKCNSKVIRKVLRLAFLAPDITEAIILGSQKKPLSVSELQNISAHSWDEQRRLLGFSAAA